MSDQDFFFDDEDAPSTKDSGSAKPADTGKSTGSGKKSGSAGARSPKTPQPQAAIAPSASGGIFEQNMTMSVAALLMVIALLVGVIIGFLLGNAMATPATQPSASTAAPASSSGPAPLNQDQISGGLPAGHPEIGATGTTAP